MTCFLIKSADDTVLTELIADNDELDYRNNIDLFVNWCAENHLILNVQTTKEIVFNFQKNKQTVQPVKITDVSVEEVNECGVRQWIVYQKHTNAVLNQDYMCMCLRPLITRMCEFK